MKVGVLLSDAYEYAQVADGGGGGRGGALPVRPQRRPPSEVRFSNRGLECHSVGRELHAAGRRRRRQIGGRTDGRRARTGGRASGRLSLRSALALPAKLLAGKRRPAASPGAQNRGGAEVTCGRLRNGAL